MPDEPETIASDAPVRELWPSSLPGQEGRTAARARTCLWRARIGTVGELAAMSALDVADLPLAGPAVVGDIRRALAQHGLSLKDDDGITAAETEARVRVLMRAGVHRAQALRFARESWPAGEIAPGVRVEVTA
jgi:hypothetical protein